MQKTVPQFAWICEVRGMLYAEKEGSPSYAGSYKVIYFKEFKTVAYKKGGKWVLANKIFPLSYRGGVYAMARDLGL